jgi:glycerol-3-phosphate dehydrogenase (NAD(P)+)
MKTITIIGSGQMGSALAFPARENGNEVRLVGTHLDREIIDTCRATNRHPKFEHDFPEGVQFYQFDEVDEAIEGADFIICGVSSFGVEWFGSEVMPRIPEETPIISVTKGLQNLPDGSLIPYPEVWRRMLAERGLKRNLNAIGGPCTSYELVFHDQTEVSYCGEDMDTLKMIRSAMATDYYHISLTRDVMGVESAVALKNAYALGVALTVGLNQKAHGIDSKLHYNSQAAVFGQATREMAKSLAIQGADDLNNLCVGVGDLYVTVYGGRTRLIGTLLGRGLTIDEALAQLQGVTLESLVVSKRVAEAFRVKASKGEIDLADFPLLCHIDDIISNGAPVDIPWEKFTYVDE